MGTFHHDTHELHGITCVVETQGPRTYVGRVHEVGPAGVLLHDADVFDEVPGGPTKAEYLARTAAVGPWPRHKSIVVPAADVTSVRRLGDLAT